MGDRKAVSCIQMRVTIVLRSTAPRRTGESRPKGSTRVRVLLAAKSGTGNSHSMKNPSCPALLLCIPALLALTVSAQNQNQGAQTPAASAPASPAASAPALPPAKVTAGASAPDAGAANPDTTSAYYHFMVAHEYEEMAPPSARPKYATRGIE